MLNLKETFTKMIIEEIDFVIQKMEQSSNEGEKLYYFSGIYALLQRIYNLEYNADLVYAHFILRSTHETFIQRLRAIQTGDTTIPFTQELSDKLVKLTQELGEKIKNNGDIDDTLKKFVILSFLTSGNGYYLWQKEKFDI